MYRRGAGKRTFSSSTLSTVHEYCLVPYFLGLDASLYILFSSALLVYITFHFHSCILILLGAVDLPLEISADRASR